MKKQDFTFSRKRYYFMMSLIGLFMLLYLFRVVRPLIALAYYQKFSVIPAAQYQLVTKTLETTIRFDRKNPQYHSDLGTYLHQFYAEQPSPDELQREMGLQQASASLKRAVMLDPGNPWNYYELGRLEDSWHGCSSQDYKDCLATQYFIFALEKSPGNIFLRGTVASWLYEYDLAGTRHLLQQTLTRYPDITSPLFEVMWPRISAYSVLKSFLPEVAEVSQNFSEFLYAHHLDYESDLERQKSIPSSLKNTCDSADILSRSSDERRVELGRDDGSAEWRSYLASEDTRITKSICLPEESADYDEAALKIFMNSGVPGEFIADIYVDDHLIQRLEHSIPYELGWYEVPFDITLLQGKKQVHVYVRVHNASASGNYLQIMGDQDTTTTRSLFNFESTEDLSLDKEIQQGEYMIRLVLTRH